MNVTKSFYISLLSLPWISAVGPRMGPTQEQDNIMRFEDLTENEADWKVAYDQALALNPAKMPTALDTYFGTCVNYLGERVEIHLKYIQSGGNHAGGVPSELHPFDRLPKLVYMIRYYNIRILHDVQLPLQSGVDRPLLAMINEQYVTNMSTLYHEMKGKEVPFESYMMDTAVLYSMNTAMLAIHPDCQERERLQRYRNITERLHRHLARFMETTTRDQYYQNVQEYESRINELGRFKIHGYEHLDIQAIVDKVAHQILNLIAISRSDNKDGLKTLSRLLENYQAVRHILNVDELGYSTDGMFSQQLMHILNQGLWEIPKRFLARNPWLQRLRPMVEKIINLGNQKPLNRSNHLVQSGT
jgi:hypothetical protein